MADYGHPLVFGAVLDSVAESHPYNVVSMARLMEAEGLDLVALQDHPYWPERLDTLLQLANIAANTSRIRLATDVANLPLRPPAMLARQALTLDEISGGRFDLGIGAGCPRFRDLVVAEGGPVRDPGSSVEAVREAIQLIRRLWTPGRHVYFHGRHYGVEGAFSGAGAARHIDIGVGAWGPGMLATAGQLADAWVAGSPHLTPSRIGRAHRVIDDAAYGAGRRPEDIRRIYHVSGVFSASESGFLQGPPRLWAEQLTELALTTGVSGFLLYLVRSPHDLRRFAREVAPAVREMVTSERRRPGGTSG